VWKAVLYASGALLNPRTRAKGGERHITVIIEGTLWTKGAKKYLASGGWIRSAQQQAVVRIVRKGRVDGNVCGTGWEDEDVNLEVVQPGGLVEPGRTAGWRKWWRGKALRGFY
jgi:hypothetical protein